MPRSRFTQRLEVLATLLEPTRERLYRYVSDQATPVSRDQAAEAIGISRAAAAHHLDKLVESGLLRAAYRRLSAKTGRGAGRPSKLYRRSRRRFDIEVPPRSHELLARLLTQSVERGVSRSHAEDAAQGYGRSLGARARTRIASAASPIHLTKCVVDVLTALGFEPANTGLMRISTRNCPFEPLSRLYEETVCHTALALARGVVDGVGADNMEAGRDYRPDRCCIVLDTEPADHGGRETSSKTAMRL